MTPLPCALLVLTDGRPGLIEQTLESAFERLQGIEWVRFVIHDDSADPTHRDELRRKWPTAEVIGGPDRRGFGGAIHAAWMYLQRTAEHDIARHVFHLEDDFTFNRAVRVDRMARVLDANKHLVQLALRRQPWNDDERAAGGVVELHPEMYEDCQNPAGDHWLEQRVFFTTNPSLYRRSLCSRGWPLVKRSEGVFSLDIIERDPAARFAYWGPRASGEWVHHIGDERVGKGY